MALPMPPLHTSAEGERAGVPGQALNGSLRRAVETPAWGGKVSRRTAIGGRTGSLPQQWLQGQLVEQSFPSVLKLVPDARGGVQKAAPLKVCRVMQGQLQLSVPGTKEVAHGKAAQHTVAIAEPSTAELEAQGQVALKDSVSTR